MENDYMGGTASEAFLARWHNLPEASSAGQEALVLLAGEISLPMHLSGSRVAIAPVLRAFP